MQDKEIVKIEGIGVELGLTGSDWEPKASTRYYAQVLPNGIYAFGATKEEALNSLVKKLQTKP